MTPAQSPVADAGGVRTTRRFMSRPSPEKKPVQAAPITPQPEELYEPFAVKLFPFNVVLAPPKLTALLKHVVTVRSLNEIAVPVWLTTVLPVQGAAATPLPVPAIGPLNVPV